MFFEGGAWWERSDEFDELLEGGFMAFIERNYKIYFAALHKNVTLSFLYDVFNLLELWMVPMLIFISSHLQVFLSRFELFLGNDFSNGSFVYTFFDIDKPKQEQSNIKWSQIQRSIS